MTARTRAPLVRAGLAAAALVVLVACSGGRATTDLGARDEDDQRGPATEDAGDSPAHLAIAAYDESWDVTFRALNPAQETPELGQVLTGAALGDRLAGITDRAIVGHRVEGSVETHPHVVSANASEVVLDDCAVENSVEYDAHGQVVVPTDNLVSHYRVTVVNEGGTWKVSEIESREDACTPE
jgi:hypothetical protein